MITGLDHIVVLLTDIEAGVKAYELLLGCAPSWTRSSSFFKLHDLGWRGASPAMDVQQHETRSSLIPRFMVERPRR